MGASAKVDALVKSMKHMSWFQRDLELEKVAAQFGEGFAAVIRGELNKRYRSEPK